MAKILCSVSGIEFSCEHFPISLSQREYHHPIFSVSPSRLYKYYPKYLSGELTETDSYLLFLSYLKNTELVEFRTATKRTQFTQSIISQNMEKLVSISSLIASIRHPALLSSLPRICISKENNDLSNCKHWIAIWSDSISEFQSGLKEQELKSDIAKKSAGLERLIRNPAISPRKYSHMLADWAAAAASFPLFKLELNGQESTCAEYWKQIIICCYDLDSIIQIPPADLQELTDHCYEHIELNAGSLQSQHLFKCLEIGKEKITGFFGLGDLEFLSASNPGFRILDSNNSIEDANIQVMIDTAPDHMPARNEYPSEFSYMKAKFKYEAALKYKASQTGDIK